jgi:hypothetical protein
MRLTTRAKDKTEITTREITLTRQFMTLLNKQNINRIPMRDCISYSKGKPGKLLSYLWNASQTTGILYIVP